MCVHLRHLWISFYPQMTQIDTDEDRRRVSETF